MPTLTTIVELSNGTVVDRPMPYVRALVGYSGGEFCQHRHNFRALLAEWISRHMQDVLVTAFLVLYLFSYVLMISGIII